MPLQYPQPQQPQSQDPLIAALLQLFGVGQFDPLSLVGGFGMAATKPAMSPEALQRIGNLGKIGKFKLDQLLLDLGDITQKWKTYGARNRMTDPYWFTQPESLRMLMEQDDVLKQLSRYPDFQNKPPITLDKVLDLMAGMGKK